MLDLLQSVPAGVWIGLAVFGWLACATVSMAIASDGYFDIESHPGIFFGCLFGWPFALIYMAAALAVRTVQHRRVCPKCKSTF